MKKIFLTLCVAFASVAMYAAGLEGARIYVNPGHGSWGPNDRPMATIPYPALASTGMPDHDGFYESNTNLWKTQELSKKLREAGAFVMESRTECGPWPYEKVDGQYPDYSWEAYKNLPDYEKYNRSLSEIAAEVQTNNMDYMVSIHSNAIVDASLTNYLYLAVRGVLAETDPIVQAGWARAEVAWPYVFAAMGSGLEVHGDNYSLTKINIRQQELGVLKHSVPSWLSEGYFHTYQPSRHRALNPDYCREEGLRYYRGIAAWFEQAPETKGYILGTVKDLHEKMNHPLFTYRPKTHDQFVPLNGAVVTLLKGGVKVADYTVDNNYNGLFFFRDLEPGDDYTLEFACAGYKEIFEEVAYKNLFGEDSPLLVYHKGMPLTVKANETTYPAAFLENEAYIPPPVDYVDYPNPVQPSYTVLPASFNMVNKGEVALTIEGTIKRTIGVGDSTIVLSHTEDKVAHLYLIDHLTGAITTISTEGIHPIDTENQGSYLALSDVALTCDGKLVGVNYIRCQYSADYVDTGYKRGVVYIYKWDALNEAPTVWATLENQTAASGNFYRADAGYSLFVSGRSEDCTVTFTAVNTSSSKGMRFTQVALAETGLVSVGYHKPAATADCSPLTQGANYMLQLSPLNTANNFILDGELTGAYEIAVSGGNNSCAGKVDADLVGVWPSETNFFKYAGKSVMVSPYVNEENKVAGVRLIDVTNGLDNAAVIATTNTDLAEPVAATFAAATAKVNGTDVTIYLIIDGKVITFTSVGEAQDASKGVYAYGLNVTREGADFTFTFNANDTPLAADLVFFKSEKEIGRIALTDVVAGENEVIVTSMDLPGNDGDYMNWGVELKGAAHNAVAPVFTDNTSYVKAYNAVNTSPESDYFGNLYVMNQNGASSGVDVYDASLAKLNAAPYAGGQTWATPTRMAVDAEGKVYFSDDAAAHAGVFVADPAQIDGTYTALFEGTAGSDGVIKNGSTAVASHTPTVAIYSEGADKKVFIYNRAAVGGAAKQSVLQYNIGEADTWGAAPSKSYTLAGAVNNEGNLHATSHGFFLSTNRLAENGNSNYARSLQFYDYDGTNQFSSGDGEFPKIIAGSANSSYAVSADESLLVINNARTEFLFFNITWEGNKPLLDLILTHKHGLTDISQMNFDYAGNLVASGVSGLYVFAVPTANVTLTPAKKNLRVVKSSTITGVENAEIEAVQVRKVIENGQLVIIRDGIRYNVMGIRLN